MDDTKQPAEEYESICKASTSFICTRAHSGWHYEWDTVYVSSAVYSPDTWIREDLVGL